MKKVFASLFVVSAFALVSCGGAKETTTTVDSTTSAVVDSVVTPVADSTAVVDTTVKVDTVKVK